MQHNVVLPTDEERHTQPKATRTAPLTVWDACLPRFSSSAHPSVPEHAFRRLDFVPGTPPRNESACECSVEEIDRHCIVEHPTHPGRCHYPAIRAAVLVKPSGYLGIALAETAGRNTEPDTDGEAPFGGRCHGARVTWHLVFLIRSEADCHGRLVVSSRTARHSARVCSPCVVVCVSPPTSARASSSSRPRFRPARM